jgi:hypothetical protein
MFRPSFLFDPALLLSVPQRIPDMPFFLFSAFIGARSQSSPALVVEEVMLMCHRAASFDFLNERKAVPKCHTSDDVARVLEVLPAIVEKAREVSGFAADQSGKVRLGSCVTSKSRSIRLYATVSEMKEGPSGSAVRC